MKISKKQLDQLVEQVLKQRLNEAQANPKLNKLIQQVRSLSPEEFGVFFKSISQMKQSLKVASYAPSDKDKLVYAFRDALNGFMSTFEWEGLEMANPSSVSRKLNGLKSFDPNLASQVGPLWKQILQLAKEADRRESDPMLKGKSRWQHMNQIEDKIRSLIRKSYPQL